MGENLTQEGIRPKHATISLCGELIILCNIKRRGSKYKNRKFYRNEELDNVYHVYKS